VLVHIVNFYLEEGNQTYCRRLIDVARSNSPAVIEILALYAREALRLDPVTVGITREAGSSMFVPGVSERVNLHPGDKVFLSLKKANLDEVCYCFGIIES
jgi:cytochrome P450